MILIANELRNLTFESPDCWDRYRNSAIARSLNDDRVTTAHGGSRWYPSTVWAVVLAHTGKQVA